MKKTFIVLMALAGVAMATTYQYHTTLQGSLDNAAVYALTLNINNATNISPVADTETPETLTTGVKYGLTSLSFNSRIGIHQDVSTGDFGLFVLDSNKTVVGWSSNSNACQTYGSDDGTTVTEHTFTFNFNNTWIAPDQTYTLVAVGTDALAAVDMGYTYTPGTNSLTVNTDAKTIGGAMKYIGVRVDYHPNVSTTGANWINNTDATSVDGTWGAVITNITLIPEPTTATLSLLALTGLAARRRRR
ncbi:MAG: PEP-CTERM sorting domain-containing protein [Akkermansiaceae bacterium]|nr:PEP-CTERM sorting domain-containing protein [Akkermansiaceae bacterium]